MASWLVLAISYPWVSTSKNGAVKCATAPFIFLEGSSVAGVPRAHSHAHLGLDAATTDRLHERFIVTFILVGVAFGERSDCLVETFALADVGADLNRVAGAGVGSRQHSCAHRRVV